MKKYLLALFSIVTIFAFISCGSTPVAEPQVDVNPVETPKPEPEPTPEPAPEPEPEPTPEPAPAEDFSAQNSALLAQADSARQKAVDAGAEKYFPEILSETDKIYESVKNEVQQNPNADHSEKIKDVIARYESLAVASMAKALKEKASELGISDADAEKALSDYESASKNGTGSDMKDAAEKALSAYSKLMAEQLGALIKTERAAALEAKKKADSVKAGVAKKAEYTEASNTFKKADSNFVTKDLEGAYRGYISAKNTFNALYESIAEKRAAAQAAIERAKKRVSEAENYTLEADSIAPLSGEVAGIEKEDAVLLEADNFANPDDAVIDLEDSVEAKTAAAIDGAINAASDAINGAINKDAK